MDTNVIWTALFLSFRLATITTVILLMICIPFAYWLSRNSNWGKVIVETIVTLPLVLPPTVLGFYLLISMSSASAFGSFFEEMFNVRLVFSFTGLVIGSLIYSLPFMVQPLQVGFQSLPTSLEESSYSLGKSKLVTIWKVLLPNMKPALFSGAAMTFAHTIGEFGVVLMIGGSIPGATKVASIAVFEEVESMNYAAAHQLSLILLLFSFTILLAVNLLNKRIIRLGR